MCQAMARSFQEETYRRKYAELIGAARIRRIGLRAVGIVVDYGGGNARMGVQGLER